MTHGVLPRVWQRRHAARHARPVSLSVRPWPRAAVPAAPGQCCSSAVSVSLCWAGPGAVLLGSPLGRDLPLGGTGVTESRPVEFQGLPSLKLSHLLWHAWCCLVMLCAVKGHVVSSHLCSACFSRSFPVGVPHFFWCHHIVWTASLEWLHGKSRKFRFRIVLLKHKVTRDFGYSGSDALSVRSRRTKAVVPWEVNLGLGTEFWILINPWSHDTKC